MTGPGATGAAPVPGLQSTAPNHARPGGRKAVRMKTLGANEQPAASDAEGKALRMKLVGMLLELARAGCPTPIQEMLRAVQAEEVVPSAK